MYLICLVFVAGCSNGSLEDYEGRQAQVDLELVGVPILFGGLGSSVPITKNLSLTAKHIAMFNYSNVVAHHPDCDISLIESQNNGDTFPDFSEIFSGQKVRTVGRSLYRPLVNISGDGEYLFDVFMVDSFWNSLNCTVSIIDAPVQSGMSGGGVYDKENSLVGIIVGKSTSDSMLTASGAPLKNVSMMISILFIKPWLLENINKYGSEG